MPLNNRVALITSSRRGMCADAAIRLAQAGAKVMICGRNASEGQRTVSQIQQAGGSAGFVLTDITTASDVQAAVDETIATYGRLDIVCNGSTTGLMANRPLLDVSEVAWDQVIEASLKGTFLCCQYAAPFLETGGNGKIINLLEPVEDLSSNGIMPICYGGLLGLTQSLAQHFASGTVTINAVWAIDCAAPIAEMMGDRVLTSPLPSAPADTAHHGAEDSSFSSIEDAVMYLSLADEAVQGYTLLVTASSPSSRGPSS